MNKTALVTGASTGIGRAIAVALVKRGATVGLVARSKDPLEQTRGLVEKASGKGEIFPLDLQDTQAIYRLADTLKTTWKKLDILVNVAGIYHTNTKAFSDIPFEKYTVEEIRNTYEVTLGGTTFLTHALLPLMGKGSHIINISGTFESGAKGWLPYYVAKRAIEDFTVGLAEEVKDKEIFVNCISPSDTATEAYAKFFPQYLSDTQPPERIGEFVSALCHNENPPTGKIFVLKKDKDPYEQFHA